MSWGRDSIETEKGRGERKTNHFRKTSSSDDVAGVDETVQVPGGFFYRLPHLVVAVEIKDVRDEVKSILVVLNFRVEAGKVEAIRQVVLVDLAKILVAARRYKL